MYQLQTIDKDNTVLEHAPLIRGAAIILQYLTEHKTIGLTQTKAFQRKFVRWAAEEFAWPGFDLEGYFSVSKVMNEYDFAPLELLHFIMLKLKLIRHYKSTCRLTKIGAQMADKPGDLYNLIAPFYLFEIDHCVLSRVPDPLIGNWGVFLSVLNVETEMGISTARLRSILYGRPEAGESFDRTEHMIESQLLRPLCWIGVLAALEADAREHVPQRTYFKTPLWRVAFMFPNDPQVEQPTRH